MRSLQRLGGPGRLCRPIAVGVVLAAGAAPIDAAAVVTCKYASSTTYAGLTGSCQQYNCSNGTSYHNWVNSSYYLLMITRKRRNLITAPADARS